jgi:hypothetical protein
VSVWLASCGLTALVASAAGYDGLAPGTYRRWDSDYYVAIARGGYDLRPCDPVRDGYPPDRWCGTAGWMPAYPYLLRFGRWLGASDEAFGWAVAQLTWLAVLVLLAEGFPSNAARGPPLFLAAVFPGGIYCHALFPISLALAFLLLTLHLSIGGRWLLAGLAGAGASVTYTSGVLLAAVVPLWILLDGSASWPKRLGRAALVGGLTIAGFVGVLALHHVAAGAWDALFRIQERYGHGVYWPSVTLVRAARGVAGLGDDGAPFVVHAQTLFVAAALVGLLAWFVAARRWRDRTDLLVAVCVAVYGLAPLVVGPYVSRPRSEAMLLPVVLLVRRLPYWVQGAVIVPCAVLFAQQAQLFFQGELI